MMTVKYIQYTIYRAPWYHSFRGAGREVETIQKQKRNNVRESQFRTDVSREFQRDGAAVLCERLPKDIHLKGTCSSRAEDINDNLH